MIGGTISLDIPCLVKMKPTDVERVANREILNFVSSKMIFTQCFINHQLPSELWGVILLPTDRQAITPLNGALGERTLRCFAILFVGFSLIQTHQIL